MTPQPRRPQQGVALLLMLLVLFVLGLGGLLPLLNAGTATRERLTQQALAEAREALIGYVTRDDSFPGQFPCPENLTQSPVEGQTASTCTQPAERVGRLPWKTLGLGRLTDGDGEPLWYAVSASFRNAPINLTTQPEFGLDGLPNQAIAVIFSPGPPLAGQTRLPATPLSPPNRADYLDQGNAAGIALASSGPSSLFNDRLLAIAPKDIALPLTRRVLGEVRGIDALTGLTRYVALTGSLPWPDSNKDGYADTGTGSGGLPYRFIPGDTKIPFDSTTLNWLDNNAWFPMIGYTRLSASKATLSLGTQTQDVTP